MRQNSTNGSAPSTYTFPFALDGLAEINAAGGVVQYSNLSETAIKVLPKNYTDGQLLLGFQAIANVTNGSGIWSPTSILSTGIAQTGSVRGHAAISLTFQLQESPANVTALKFDTDFTGWPWASPADHLGLLLGTLAETGAHFTWNAASQNLTEELNTAGGPIAGLQLGPLASTFDAQPSTANVSSDVGLYTVGSPARGAYLLVNFTGGNPDFTSLHYDPWIIFSPHAPSPAGVAPLFDKFTVIAVVLGIATALVLGIVAHRARRTTPEAGMRSWCGIPREYHTSDPRQQ